MRWSPLPPLRPSRDDAPRPVSQPPPQTAVAARVGAAVLVALEPAADRGPRSNELRQPALRQLRNRRHSRTNSATWAPARASSSYAASFTSPRRINLTGPVFAAANPVDSGGPGNR